MKGVFGLVFSATLIFPNAALADNWVSIGSVPKGRIDLDSHSVKRDGSFVYFRTRLRLPRPKDGIAVIAERNLMSCPSGQGMVTSVAAFNQRGRMIGEQSLDKKASTFQVQPGRYSAFCSASSNRSQEEKVGIFIKLLTQYGETIRNAQSNAVKFAELIPYYPFFRP